VTADEEATEDRLVAIAVAAAPPLTIGQIDELRGLLAPAFRAIRDANEGNLPPATESAKPARAA
jgi:hypothetical protein